MPSVKKQESAKETFEKLFQEYADTVYRLCLYKTSDGNIAHDLTQETFMRLWKRISSEKVIEKPKQYIYQIARNLIVDHYKSKSHSSLEQLSEEGFKPLARGQSAETMTDIAILRGVIDTLDQDFREVIYLRFVEDMKVADIAAILDISENLVSVRINRGKKKLKEKFA